MKNGIDSLHPQYQKTMLSAKLVRDSVEGEVSVKAPENQTIYLPPDCENMTKDQRSVYNMKLRKAEYDSIPANTLGTLLGAIQRQPHDFSSIPQQLSYMEDDVDGDGMNITEFSSLMVSELLQMRYCGLLAEHSDLASAGLAVDSVTVAQARAANLRASVKLYARESIINWDFKTVNGVKQLSFVVLKETESVAITDSLETELVDSYLLLSIDEEGYYYQMKYTEELNGFGGWSERVYPTKTSGLFDYIPFEFCIMGDYQKGKLPLDCGYLFPICSKTISRYQQSAEHKLAMWYSAAPITFSTGWDSQAIAVYTEATGLSHVQCGPGAHVPLPDGANMGIINWASESSAFEVYFKRNAKEIEALGGVFDTDEQDESTATAKAINAAEKKNALSSVVDSVESCLNKVIMYCGEFRGITSQPEIKLNREFTVTKITPQERASILSEWQTGLITELEALTQLERGGVLTQKAEDMLNQFNNNGQ